ncbi:Lrp/AsnC family transcriptional regulator [Salinarchaeum sp. IM2453]|uniref:Lrp/AsnC family transcriptional regulator n=1 Tax=Salinarchaeum sp. IM2453 TaxID=2862870 RepID=UPI001C8396CA|nr:Lrp/AsnC family transcriptional regulator [Salinarchaeum sp. IM2453]
MDEQELIDLLLDDARRSTEDIARILNTDVESVEAAIKQLEEKGIIRGYQAVIDWGETSDERVRAEVELNVKLDRETSYIDIADRLVQFPEVESLQLVSGDYDFHMRVEGDSMREVSQFVSDQIAPIPEITQTVTHYVMDRYKENGVAFNGGDDDDRLSISP